MSGEINIWEKKYNDALNSNEDEKRKAAMDWISHMNPREFQEKLFNGTLPEFERKKLNTYIEVTTQHHYYKMTEDDFIKRNHNQGYVNKLNLESNTVEEFKKLYY